MSDGADRQSIQDKLKLCIDQLVPTSHPPTIVNIVSGQVADDKVNVQAAVAIGTRQMQEFEKGWPEGFQSTISKKVNTVSDSTRHIKVGSQKVYDTSVIYGRVIGIQASSRDIESIKSCMSWLLCRRQCFMILASMRICKAKSGLKKRLAKEASSRCSTSNVAASVLDGSAVLWVVHWPAKGVIADFVENFKGFLLKKLLDLDVYLIFDRYREYRTKSVTRDARTCEAITVYQLTENTPLPSQKAVLTVSSNKKQLMSIICSSINNDEEFHAQHTTRNNLVITSSDDVPNEIQRGCHCKGRYCNISRRGR